MIKDNKNTLKFNQTGIKDQSRSQDSNRRIGSENAVTIEDREVDVSHSTIYRVGLLDLFEPREIFTNILERCIQLNNGFYQVLVDLKRTNKALYRFIEGFVVTFLQKFAEPLLANLQWSHLTNIPFCLKIDLKKTVTLFSLATNQSKDPACLDYIHTFEKRLDECISSWQNSDFAFSCSDEKNLDFSYNLQCWETEFILNSNDRQQSYILSRFLERYFSHVIVVKCYGIVDTLCKNWLSKYEKEEILHFINFLSRYQTFENVSKLLYYIIDDLCNATSSSKNLDDIILFLLQHLAQANLIPERFEKRIFFDIILIPDMLKEHTRFNALEDAIETLVYFAQINARNLEKIINVFREKKMQERELMFLISCAKKNLISKELGEKLVYDIILLFKECQTSVYSLCIDLLISFSNSKNNLISQTDADALIPSILAITTNPELELRAKTLKLLCCFLGKNLIPITISKTLGSLAIKILNNDNTTQVKEWTLILLGYLIKTNLFFKEDAERLMLAVKTITEASDFGLQYIIKLFVILVKYNLIQAEKIISLVYAYLKEKSFDLLYLKNIEFAEDIMPLWIPMIENKKEDLKIKTQEMFEKHVFANHFSPSFAELLLLFVIEMLGQKAMKIDRNFIAQCFNTLIKANLMNSDRLVNSMLSDPRTDVQEYGFELAKLFQYPLPKPTRPLPQPPQNIIVNQKANVPCILQTTLQYYKCVNATLQSLFSINSFYPIARTVFCCNLKSILVLRSVSKGFYYLASLIYKEFPHSPLTDKAAIYCEHNQLYPDIDPSVQEKFDFAKQENIDLYITHSVTDIIQRPLNLSSIADNKLKIILKINNFNEVKQLQEFLAKQTSLILTQDIQGLDLSEVQNDASDLISMDFITNIKKLIINNLSQLAIPSILKIINSITTIEIKKTSNYFELISSNVLHNLTTLKIEKINDKSAFKLPIPFNNVATIEIGCIGNNAILELPSSLPQLTTFELGDIGSCFSPQNEIKITDRGVTRLFQDLSKNPTTLNIRNINSHTICDLPHLFSYLKTLKIGIINDNVTFKLQGTQGMLDYLEILEIKNIGRNSFLKLPSILAKLKSLEIDFISKNSNLQLPEFLPDLETLKIGTIDGSIKLPDALPKLVTCEIQRIGSNNSLQLSNHLPNLEILKIGTIGDNVTIKLPESLPELTTFEIQHIGSNTSFQLSNSLDKLEILKIGTIDDGVIFKLPDSLPELTTFEIQHIASNTFSQFPASLPNFQTFKIGSIYNNNKFELPPSFNNLRTLTIGDISTGATLKISNPLDNLTIFQIETIFSNATLILPDLLPNIVMFDIKTILSDVTLKLPVKLRVYTEKNNLSAHIKHNSLSKSQNAWTKPLESYHYYMKPLFSEDVKPHLRYIAQSGYAHKSLSGKLIKPFGYQPIDPETIGVNLSDVPGIEILEGEDVNRKTQELSKTEKCFANKTTGLKIIVSKHENTKEIVLAFGDLSSLMLETKGESSTVWWNQTYGLISNFTGMNSAIYQQAGGLAKLIIKRLSENSNYKDYTFTFTGQSLGGSLAQFAGLCNGVKTMCYNAFPLGSGLQKLIGDEKLKNADLYITHLTVEKDYVSDMQGSGSIDWGLSKFWLRTPGNFGKRFSIPAAYYNIQHIHSFVLGSAMQYLNLDKKTLPQDLIEQAPELLITTSEKLDERMKAFELQLQDLFNSYQALGEGPIKDAFVESQVYKNFIINMKTNINFSETLDDLKKYYKDFENHILYFQNNFRKAESQK